MEQINETRREALEAALNILTGDNGRIYPACALSNQEAAGHDTVLAALRTVTRNACPEYLARYEWDFMNDSERAEYGAADYAEFCDVCNSFNDSVINKAIRDAKAELGK